MSNANTDFPSTLAGYGHTIIWPDTNVMDENGTTILPTLIMTKWSAHDDHNEAGYFVEKDTTTWACVLGHWICLDDQPHIIDMALELVDAAIERMETEYMEQEA